jgi:cellulose synthase/poly-beta-1,6-N-acetylglucosamine synthase-like glycosyltransferase
MFQPSTAAVSAGEAPPVSVVTCAYNEEANIGGFLDGCLTSTGPSFQLSEILVVASGCTDRTAEIVREFAQRDPRVRLIVESSRNGKASALRIGLSSCQSDIIVVEGADTVPAPGAFEALLAPLRRPEVALVCAHPEPANSSDAFVVRMARTMWEIHDLVSRIEPKAGEAYAFRRRPFALPHDVEDDDTYIGVTSTNEGGSESVYAADAVVFNRVPTTISDFLHQRWRINFQILGLRESTGILTSTWDPKTLLRAVGRYLRQKPRALPYVACLAVSEAMIRGAALSLRTFRRAPMIAWAPIASTKGAISLPTEGSR